ncbi:MAG: MBOAT family protein [Rhodobacteraceae bacterium]|nr:MBOAT family protein [Paracoccaceae bacterium]
MLFPTLEFALFFCAVLTLNQFVARSPGWRKALLLAASYMFYAAWDWRFCGLMAAASAVAWGGGLLAGNRARPGLAKAAMITSIVALMSLLAVFKYFNFFTLSLQQLFDGSSLARDISWMRIVLPVGISFYTFQAVSYVVDVSRGDVAARRNPADVFLYISFFPQLVAGPIVRAADFLPQIDAPFRVTRQMRAVAVVLILSGLLKKMVIANYISVGLVDPVFDFPQAASMLEIWAATLGYGVQIYCDFSGYSDIAIGVALLLGYRFARNFDQPYRAKSFADFWRRWHISLSSWIRDYLYIPLGGNSGGALRQSGVLMLVMLLAGLWHGAGWNFVLWGGLHGAVLVAERASPWRMRLKPALVFAVVFALWVPFRAADMGVVGGIFSGLFGGGAGLGTISLPLLVLMALGLALNWLPVRWRLSAEQRLGAMPTFIQAALLALGTVLLFGLAQDGTAPFIYFQF